MTMSELEARGQMSTILTGPRPDWIYGFRSNELFRFHADDSNLLVHNFPSAVETLEALGGAPMHVDLLAIPRRAADMMQAVAESDVERCDDLQADDLVGHRPIIAVEPLLATLSHRIDAAKFERPSRS